MVAGFFRLLGGRWRHAGRSIFRIGHSVRFPAKPEVDLYFR